MSNQESDRSVSHHIEQLVKEEHGLYGRQALSDADRERLKAVQVELDQCWDLLRQRRALREFGEDLDHAWVRPSRIVETYEQ